MSLERGRGAVCAGRASRALAAGPTAPWDLVTGVLTLIQCLPHPPHFSWVFPDSHGLPPTPTLTPAQLPHLRR